MGCEVFASVWWTYGGGCLLPWQLLLVQTTCPLLHCIMSFRCMFSKTDGRTLFLRNLLLQRSINISVKHAAMIFSPLKGLPCTVFSNGLNRWSCIPQDKYTLIEQSNSLEATLDNTNDNIISYTCDQARHKVSDTYTHQPNTVHYTLFFLLSCLYRLL